MAKSGINVHAENLAKGFVKARVFYEDRIETREDLEVFVADDMIKINLVLDDEDLGKVTKIQLLNEDDVVVKDRPFVFEVTGEHNVYVGFWYRVTEKEITKDKYIGGEVKYE